MSSVLLLGAISTLPISELVRVEPGVDVGKIGLTFIKLFPSDEE